MVLRRGTTLVKLLNEAVYQHNSSFAEVRTKISTWFPALYATCLFASFLFCGKTTEATAIVKKSKINNNTFLQLV